MMTSAQMAPIQGCPAHELMAEVPTTLARTVVRNVLSAVSTVVNGLKRMRMLMALEARKTMKNTAMATGVTSRSYSQLGKLAAAKPSEPKDAPGWPPVELASWMMLTMIGTNAPVATRPEILCSMLSMASSGFLAAVGSATPAVSLRKQRASTKNAGTQKTGLANQGSFARCSSVSALQYW